MRVRVLLVAVALLALVAASCSQVLDQVTLEAELTGQVADSLQEPDLTVDCPADVEVEQGAIFHCTAGTPDGARTTVEVTQVDDSGGVEWRLVDVAPDDGGDGG